MVNSPMTTDPISALDEPTAADTLRPRPARGPARPRRAAAPAAEPMATGPRIYDLFPRLVGSVSAWALHLPRISGMGFDWVYVNSFHATGRSGSLYAVSDPFALNPDFANAGGSGDEMLREFTASAARYGLKAMMDLTIAYLARDSVVAADHPAWFRRRPDGDVDSPGPWSDLAAIDYGAEAPRAEIIEFWRRYIRHYRALGFAGFVCKSAHLVPAEVWRAIFGPARADRDAVFIADTVGAPIEATERLAGAGFDYLFNSMKWWDLRADWALEQQARLRTIAPTIAFPESHDTPRLAAGAGTGDRDAIEARLKFQISLAALFSAGWMMPIGTEYGFTRPLDVVHTRPEDWEPERVDLTRYVAALNAARVRARAVNREGAERRITARDQPVVGLLRLSGDHPLSSDSAALILLNPDTSAIHTVDAGFLLAETGGRFGRWRDVTPAHTPVPLEPGRALSLSPLEVRLFEGETVARKVRAPDQAESERAVRQAARQRVTIERVMPEIDGGRYPVKRIVGDALEVEADIFADGHDKLAACIRYREADDPDWRAAPMEFVDNDRWRGRIPLARNGTYVYTIEAWLDRFESWRADFLKKRDAGQTVTLELAEAVELVKAALYRCAGGDRDRITSFLGRGETLADQPLELERLLLSDDLRTLMRRHGERGDPSRYPRELAVIVDRLAARFSAWYELFPRSLTDSPARSGTFDDVIRRLPYVQSLGFDVLYFPPIHPIGRTNRKGRNNALTAAPDDPGSPYAIGSEAGGHTTVHPDLGTLDDFKRLVRAAHAHGLEVALDFAVQCSLDHPWIKEHPDWFDWRPDGSIKFAENPPKKYEDIVNPNFAHGLPQLWLALRDVTLFWIGQGVKIFRVDNPHTKPVPFWEWMIGEVRTQHPEVIFLSEAFTRPKTMKKLAKAGFSQSYTYFTWRNTKRELTEYLTELTQTEMQEYYRPNFFTNTPDINPFILQAGGRPAFMMRAALAATLASAYGIYSGFELCEAAPLPGREEYLDSEKYEIKPRDWDQPGHIRDYIAALNRIRRDNPALHDFRNLRFYNADDDQILVYGKATPARDNVILAAVTLDPVFGRGSRFEVPLWEFGLPDSASLAVEDLFTGRRFTWHGKFQQVWLDPRVNPAAIWRLGRPA
jgi:starch synthase (maltosyl-transferring)